QTIVDGAAGVTQAVNQAEGVMTLVRADGDDEVVDRPRGIGKEAAAFEELAEYNVAHTEPERREIRAGDDAEQVVVPPATADRAELALGIEHLENDARVVSQPPNDAEVEAGVGREPE